MNKILGANWETTLWGGIFALSAAIAASPTLIAFLPDSIEGYVRGFAGLVVAGSGLKFAVEAKSRNVTGGTVQQTTEGCVASRSSQAESSAVIETQQASPKP